MKAMILAAGRGERLRPLTDTTPKPLLPAGGRALIEYTIDALSCAGYKDLIINVAYLGDLIQSALGNGKRFGVSIRYSMEGEAGLETGGGIFRALPLLGDQPFLVVNGDIYNEFPYEKIITKPSGKAHLVMVPNPNHNRAGDFSLSDSGILSEAGQPMYTYSGIGMYRPELFAGCRDGKFRLAPLLAKAMKKNQISGELYTGFWTDVGTLERLESLNRKLQQEGDR